MPAVDVAPARPEMDVLTQMIEDISGELALQPLLERIVERACRLIGADDGLIGLYDPQRDVVRTAATYRIPTGLIPIGTEAPRGRGLTGLVLERDAPVHCRYGDLPVPITGPVSDNDVIGMPIRAEGRLIGVFSVCAKSPRKMNDEAEELLRQFARHAAVAIVNARRYADEQRRAARFALIARIGTIITSAPDVDSLLQRVADAIHELLYFQNVDIPMIEPTDPATLVIRIRGGDFKRRIRHVDRLKIGQGIMGTAAAERRSQLVNDVAADPRYVTPPGFSGSRAELAVPILHGEELLGVLNVEGDHHFDDLDRISLEIVAEHLGLAIVNARLIDDNKQLAVLQERQRLARDLHDNVTQILSSMNLITRSLADAWRADPAEGERRAVRLGELARLAFAELHAMMRELKPDAEAENASHASPQLSERMRRLLFAMVPPEVRLELQTGGCPPQQAAHEEALLRVCQEAVSNAIHHAAPSRVRVTMVATATDIRLSVWDDGRGIDGGGSYDNAPRGSASRGMGFSNMQQRLAELGGSLRILRRRPRGTKIEANLPRFDRTKE
jgi:two-component system, NarL family, sensor kinase